MDGRKQVADGRRWCAPKIAQLTYGVPATRSSEALLSLGALIAFSRTPLRPYNRRFATHLLFSNG